MADTVAGLVTQVIEEGDFDATEAQVLVWLTRRQRTMVADSRCYRKTTNIGPTVANQSTYSVPADVVEILELLVGGVPYGSATHLDLAQGPRGYVVLDGDGGVAARTDSAAGVEQVALYPTPTTAGLAVTIYAVYRAPDLVSGSDATLVIPGEFSDALVAGAIATGLRRTEARADLAQPHEEEFMAGVEKLRRRVNRKHRKTGPARVRVAWGNRTIAS